MDKENVHPNLQHLIKHKKSYSPWAQLSSQPKISQFKPTQNDWRKKLIVPSQQQKEIDKKLSKMLDSQKTTKQCMKTNLSQDKLINSFISSANHTLQKYFQQSSFPIRQQQVNHKKQLNEIAFLLHKLFDCKVQVLQCLSQQQLIYVIKSNLKALINNKQKLHIIQ